MIIEIAEQSPVLTMKGTCFFVIGLISCTQMGAEILEEYGWVSTRTPLGQTTGLCLPNDISRFAYIEPWAPREVDPSLPALPALSGLEGEVMHMISNLSNYVLAAGAMNNLKRVRTRHPRMFSSTTLFYRAMRAISTNHFQAPVRRFILDLFDVELGPHTLPRLAHLERGSYAWGSACKDDADADKKLLENGGSGGVKQITNQATDNDNDADTRRRARSSPGPEPPTAAGQRRSRGLTTSELTPTHVRAPTAPPMVDPLDPMSPGDSSPGPPRAWRAALFSAGDSPSTPIAAPRPAAFHATPPTIKPPVTKPSALGAVVGVQVVPATNASVASAREAAVNGGGAEGAAAATAAAGDDQ